MDVKVLTSSQMDVDHFINLCLHPSEGYKIHPPAGKNIVMTGWPKQFINRQNNGTQFA